MTAAASAAGLSVSLASIQEALRELQGVAIRTPMVHTAGWLAGGAAAYLKCEHLQSIGAFKIRGAHTAIARLDPSVRARGEIGRAHV